MTDAPPLVTTTTAPTPPAGWTVANVGPRGITALLRTVTTSSGRPVVVARFPAATTALHLHLGSQDPPGGASQVPPDAQSAVASSNDEASLLVGAFNGGFKRDAGAGGVIADGVEVSPISAGPASAVIDGRGRLAIGAWGQGFPVPSPDRTVAVRQNLGMLVVGGRPTSAALAGGGPWGATLGSDPAVARSGLGTSAEGDAIFAGAMHAMPADIAEALVAGGAVTGMQLDINPYWVTLGTTPAPGGGLVSQVPGETNSATIFQSGWERDFFTVMAKPARGCSLRFPGPAGVPGPAAATTACWPQHLATPWQPARSGS